MYVRCILIWLISYLYALSAKADCQAPQSLNVYSITYQSASFSWYSNYYTNPPTYQLQWRVAGNTNWNTNPVTTSSLSLTGLTNNTTYEWRVRTICVVGDTSAYTSGTAFQTKCDLPTYLSVSNVTHESAQLSWNPSANGATYELQWRPAGSSNWSVVSNLTTGYYKLTGLTDQTAYEWQIRTICSGSVMSDFVSGPPFQTRCLPPTNLRISVVNPDAAEVKWDSPIANVLYDLQWRPAGSSTWTLVEGITTNEYQITGLTNATDYVWQVRTSCTTTSKSSFSDAQYFRTTCPRPTNLSTGVVTYNMATLQWGNFVSDLQWRVAGATDWITISNVRSPFNLTGLANNTTYEWRVRTVCSSTAASTYTSSQIFATQCSAPTYAYASSNQFSGFDVFWSAPEDGPFEIQWRVSGSTSWSIVTGIIGTSYRLTGLSAQTSYDWRVRRVCSITDYSSFLTGQFSQITCSPPSYGQSGNATSSSIDLAWQAGATGSRYDVQWRVSGASDWSIVSNISVNQYALTGLQNAVAYEWRVRKTCPGGTVSDYTTAQSFTLTCSQPGYFYTNNIDISSAAIGWSASSGNTFPPYEVQYRPLGATTWIVVPAVSTNPYLLTGLTNNTTYEWRVRAACSVGESVFSPTQMFQTHCNTPVTPLVMSTDFSSAHLSWYTNSDTKTYEIQYRESGSTDWVSIRPEGSETDHTFEKIGYNYTKEYTLYNLLPGKTYEWRVRTICTASIYSDFTLGPSFKTGCSVPQSINGIQLTNTSLKITWYAPTVTPYELQWRAAGASAWNTISNLTSDNYTLTGLTTGGTYEYRVRQQCSPDVMSDYSAAFTAQLRCIGPSYLTINQTLSASSVQLQWVYVGDYVDGSTISHEVHYRIAGTQNWTSITGIVGTMYSLTGLTAGTSYEVGVRAFCSPGLQTDFATNTFTIACPAPYTNSYNSQIGATAAVLSWYTNGLQKSPFVFQWRIAGAPTWNTVSVPYPQATSSVTYALTGLTNSTAYEWRVAATCGTDYTSDFSSIQSFQTTCPVAQSLYTKSVGSTSAQLSWYISSMVPTITLTIQYRVSGQIVWSELNGITGTNVLLTNLAANTAYEWRIRTDCGSGNAAGYSSTVSTFSTQCQGPTNLSASSITTRSAQLVWTSNPDNAFVNLRWRPANANTGWNVVTGLTGSIYSLTGLVPNTYYEYQLQGVCSVENQMTNATWTSGGVTTSAIGPLVLNADSVTAQAARFNWLNGPDQTNYVIQWRVQNGTWNTSGPLTTKRYLLTGLLINTVYEVRLSYTDDYGSVNQASTTIITACSGIEPYNQYTYDITSTKARLTWTAIGIPTTLQWRVAGTTTWNAIPGLITGTYTLTGLANNTMYEWRLVTSCAANVATSSYPSIFRTVCAMPTPIITQNISTEAALLTWTGTGFAYTLRYRIVGTSDWATLSNLTSTTFVLTGLTNNTTYEWAVATVCEANTSTTFTSPMSFRTQCSSPINLYVNRLAPDWAELQWSRSGPTSQLQWRVVGQTAWNNQAAVTSPFTLTGLTPGSTYEWRVRSTCLAEPDGAFVYGSNFTPQCDSYSYPVTTQNITPGSARLVWSATPPSLYGVRWRAVGSSNWNVVPGNATSPYLLTGLTNNTTYEWQLRSACQPNYGSSQIFQTHCNSPINLQTDALTSTAVTLKWNDPGDGVGYKIRWRTAGSSTWNTASNISVISYSLQGLSSATAYEWQVGSQCANDDSDFQVTASFKTIDPNACPQGMYTVKAGSWDDPTVWSCNRLPVATDAVQVKHVITVQTNYVAKALSIRYDMGGQLTFGSGAAIQMGN